MVLKQQNTSLLENGIFEGGVFYDPAVGKKIDLETARLVDGGVLHRPEEVLHSLFHRRRRPAWLHDN